jgi:hypothetical protein
VSLFGMPARQLQSAEQQNLLAQMRHDSDLPELDACRFWVYEVAPPFYRDYKLYHLFNLDAPHPELTRLLYKPGSLHELDWTNEPIYTVNELAPVRIQQATVLPYLRFFFGSVCARLGGFRVVETAADVPWLSIATAQECKLVESHLKPMSVAGVDTQGLYRVPATVLFMRSLFTVDLMVASREAAVVDPEENSVERLTIGQVAMHNEELLCEELDVRDFSLQGRMRCAFQEASEPPEEALPETDSRWMN